MRRILQQRFRKRGLPPGTLVRVANEDVPLDQPAINVVDYLPETVAQSEVENINDIIPYTLSSNPTWIDISGNHPIETMKRLGEILGLHPLTLEDILNTDQRPKTEDFEKLNFTVLKKPSYRPGTGIQLEQVSILITPTCVVSIHQRTPAPGSPIRARMMRESGRIRNLGTDYLAYVIIDSIVDDYFLIMELTEDRIQEIEAELADEGGKDIMQRIHSLKQEVIRLRRSTWPLREVISALSYTTSPLFDEGIKIYLKDLQDHIVHIIELSEVYRDMIAGTLDVHLSSMSHKLNSVMKTLTMIASIFIPLSFITGIYGMNFTRMPGLTWTYGYPVILAVMLAVALGMLGYFKKKKWW